MSSEENIIEIRGNIEVKHYWNEVKHYWNEVKYYWNQVKHNWNQVKYYWNEVKHHWGEYFIEMRGNKWHCVRKKWQWNENSNQHDYWINITVLWTH